MRDLFLERRFERFGYGPGKYDITLQANSSPFGSSILTENVIVGYGNLRIFGGLPKPGFRHGKDIRVGSVLKQ